MMTWHLVSGSQCSPALRVLGALGAIIIWLQFSGLLNAQSSNAATYTCAGECRQDCLFTELRQLPRAEY